MQNFNITDPEKAGINEELLSKAIDFAIKNESSMDRDIGAALEPTSIMSLIKKSFSVYSNSILPESSNPRFL